jgi:hypothetical protein
VTFAYPVLPWESWEEAESARLHVSFASSRCVCEDCGLEFWRHPYDWGEVSNPQPCLVILCGGRRVKL